jgi:dienelactone hydrolase
MGIGLKQAVVALLTVASMAGCGDSATERSATDPTTAATPADTPGAAEPWVALGGELGRCGPQPPRLAAQQFRTLTLRAPGRVLPAVTTGSGGTVVVLVHQTDGGGFCGWLDFAARIAEAGHTALAFDLCGYGHSNCAEGSTTIAKQVEQVRTAIDAAARRLHARRIVVVGASMGGSVTVHTAARDRRLDAAVDLSGPDGWNDAQVHRSADGVQVPLLVVMADDERAEELTHARETAGAAAHGEFVEAPSGHGYELLAGADGNPTPIAERVLALIGKP